MSHYGRLCIVSILRRRMDELFSAPFVKHCTEVY
jgi:hypothetical protein